MDKFIPRPYKLYNKIQNYDWGTKNDNAFIPKFIGEKIKPDVPYAELWIGAHQKSPSEIELDGKRIPLNIVIEEYTHECLGDYVSKKFNGKFPFLLKVLSASRALSIQTHPNKSQAEKLHAKDPENYPDDNHKTEIAIAVDSLIAIAGFRPVKEIIENLRTLPELRNYIETNLIETILITDDKKKAEELIKELYGEIMLKAEKKEKLAACINKIVERFSSQKTLSHEESQFLNQYKLFGTDVGLLSFFFFNIIQLQSGQAIFTNAGIPHAYIKGNIIECMANSDNVVRAGLTNKFKDVDSLLEILSYTFRHYNIINSEQKADEITYKTSAKEFEISGYQKKSGFERVYESKDKPSVYLISDGALNVEWNKGKEKSSQKFTKGESFLIPASLSEYLISSESGASYFIVEIP